MASVIGILQSGRILPQAKVVLSLFAGWNFGGGGQNTRFFTDEKDLSRLGLLFERGRGARGYSARKVGY